MGMTTLDDYWWIYSLKEWRKDAEGLCSSHCECNSVRAFRRRLKKCPKSVEFILVSRWKGYDVYGKNTTKSK
jgi:hypothetical protein